MDVEVCHIPSNGGFVLNASQDINVELSVDMLEEMKIEGIMVNTANQDEGVMLLSKKQDSDIEIHIYRLARDFHEKKYHLADELQVYSFPDYEQAQEFVQHLPRMTAIEMLLLQQTSTSYQ